MREFLELQSMLGAIALRFYNLYRQQQDPRNSYSGVISLFLKMVRGGKDITILGNGMMNRDFVHIKDIARAIILALLCKEGEEDNGGGEGKGHFHRRGGGKSRCSTFTTYAPAFPSQSMSLPHVSS